MIAALRSITEFPKNLRKLLATVEEYNRFLEQERHL